MNFVRLYIGDYQRDTGTLSLAEHGAYLLMIQIHCATERPLPDGEALFRLLRATNKAEKLAINRILRDFWTRTESGYVNARCLTEIAAANKQKQANQTNGAMGGRPKKTESVSESVSELDSETKPNNNPIHSHNQEEELRPPVILPHVEANPGPKQPKMAQAPFVLPEWVPVDAWKGWLEMRTKQRKRPTARAMALAVSELQKLAAAGNEPGAVLDQSTANGWTGLFQLRSNGNGKDSGYSKSRAQRVAERLDEIARADIERNGLPDFVDGSAS